MEGILAPMQTVLMPYDCVVVPMTQAKRFAVTGRHPVLQINSLTL